MTTNTANLAQQLAYACTAHPEASSQAVRCAFQLAILNSSPDELRLLASQFQQEHEPAASDWLPASLAGSLRLYADDLARSPLALGGK
jgi:hypothetical protein